MKALPFILTPSGHLYEADEAIQPATHYLYTADDHVHVKRLRDALQEAQRAINSMKAEAETAGAGGDEQMLQDAAEAISNEGLQADMAIRAALKEPQ